MRTIDIRDILGKHTLEGVGYYDCDTNDESGAPIKYGWFVLDGIKYDVYMDKCEGGGDMMCHGLEMRIPIKNDKNIKKTKVLLEEHKRMFYINNESSKNILVVGTSGFDDKICRFVFDYTPKNI